MGSQSICRDMTDVTEQRLVEVFVEHDEATDIWEIVEYCLLS